jgi:hypothetical protein
MSARPDDFDDDYAGALDAPQGRAPSDNPFALAGGMQQYAQPAVGGGSGGGFVAIEQQRASTEAQLRIFQAITKPRNPAVAVDKMLNECDRPIVAEHAVYSYARGGTAISGPSIKLLEMCARHWGNLSSGIRIMSSANGVTEAIAYAWDLESGYYDERQFHVKHWRDTKGGGYPLKDERDIYELVANMGQRRKRAVLEAMIPSDVIEMCVKRSERTMRANADTSPEGMQKLLAAFAAFGVTRKQIEGRIQRKLEAIAPAQVVNLKSVYASLRDGMSDAAQWFDADPDAAGDAGGEAVDPKAPRSGAARVKDAIRKAARPTGKSAATAAPAADDAQEQPPAIDAATLREQIMKAADRDAAWMVMDRARGASGISPQDHESLVDLIDSRFPDDDSTAGDGQEDQP